ncbi:hypothetical protein KEJ37_05930 [Candidatus Bathyarchaeota archaeon]|nr:hypothetical protein [Candidatus Bathyarchaeota archaeon]
MKKYSTNLKTLSLAFQKNRKRIVYKLGKFEASEDKLLHVPPLEGYNRIAKTKDILHVMRLLGHKNIKNARFIHSLSILKRTNMCVGLPFQKRRLLN